MVLRKSREFRCDGCRQMFWSRLTEAEAEAAFHANFPGELREERGVMCEDCWRSFRLGLQLG